ncbi:MAG: pyridoxal-phosphate dependent enzyme [Planctomycetes bacterium]|jgi:cystathionine beta-synthase|nr:pyridoxal-phosphate dependent enzyme [Planctomycetota bacterium]MBT4560967.1 pyridoxal-phosphate dependent enzyme [Planctomycetota bacterium]MBT5102187.1 pyridoxal-phosphate dependent enzyme [Planctomycetota bacterium]MBT7012532.1 pyridoxal-phosphate dependent enzyme [Planctomycetota bacterium]MBT7319293.1 pyridoxal-phosphate dependent enzyme [Planctomycetota bacterium]
MKATKECKTEILGTILEAVGNTPLVRLPDGFDPEVKCEVLLKLESLNPGGSVKDRIALRMVEIAEQDGALEPGGTIVEGTSGNTGVGLCMVAAARGYSCIIVMPDKMSQEKIQMMQAYGATVVTVPTNVPADHPDSYGSTAQRIAKETEGAWLADQFFNPENPKAHYLTTGPEIWSQCGGKLDLFVGGCGTGGTVTGISRYLKEQDDAVRVVGVDPPGSAFASFWKNGEIGELGPYAVEGVGDDIIPGTWSRELIDGYQVVEDTESFAMTQRLARELGLFAGGSSGLALVAALREARSLPEDARAVVLIPDSGNRYLSKVYSQDWLKNHQFVGSTSASTALISDLFQPKTRGFVTSDQPASVALNLMDQRGITVIPILAGEDGVAAPSNTVQGVVDLMGLANYLSEGANFDGFQCANLRLDAPPILDSSDPWFALRGPFQDHATLLIRDADGVAPFRREDWVLSLGRLSF